MYLGGIGTESSSHTSDMHHITECMHEHTHFKLEGGAPKAGASGTASQATQASGTQEELSLSAFVERMLGRGKRLLKGVWSGSDGTAAGAEQVMAQPGDSGRTGAAGTDTAGQNGFQQSASHTMAERMPGTAQIAAAATAVQTPQAIESNPYFAAVEDIGGRQNTLWQKIKVKFKDVAGQLTGHLPGRFSGSLQTKNSFHAKQEPPKQDLRKHSKFRRDEVEIDCVLTDDSYLLDSYDRKGEYSKLSTKK